MRACRPRCLDDVDDETEGEQHPGDGAGECCDQGLVGTGGEQLRHLPEKPEGGPRHVQHDGRYEQGEFRCVHGVSLPRWAAEGSPPFSGRLVEKGFGASTSTWRDMPLRCAAANPGALQGR